MIERIDTTPDVDVQPAEYKRLLGYPAERGLSSRARQLVRWTRAWYSKHGRPWTYARETDCLELSNGSVLVDGVPLKSARLQQTLREAEAHTVLLAAISAGPEIEQEAQRAWQEGKPDEYFFLETFGSAVVEHLTMMVGAELCAWAESQGMAVLPHYSPGYSGWEMAEQPQLLHLIRQTRDHVLPGCVDILDSGMLRPKKSLLAVFGVTRRVDRVGRLTELIPCTTCSFHPCQYRRRPYGRGNRRSPAAAASADIPPAALTTADPPLQAAARYGVNAKALQRWAAQRLQLNERADGSLDAVFRYEGTTCTNLGRMLSFDYRVTLGPRDEGYRIRAQQCEPAAGDEGHTAMCSYLENPTEVMRAIADDKPLLGRPLDDVLAWQIPTSAAGCYCTTADRLHKWRIVLETIHFALAQQESVRPQLDSTRKVMS